VAFEMDDVEIAELRFHILDLMMDTLKMSSNCISRQTGMNSLKAPPQQPRFALREIIDEMKVMVEEGYIKAHFSNDEKQAPLDNINFSLFHHYWFSPTETGKEAWQVRCGGK
jgi:hypothetical protein